ncbi:MAG: aa3-type cytochrome c oxidase subunit IV [Sphingomonadales bacterium]|nr:aa3-type cytochrome c oxidase subunit IV [Sphingomonadales bacterium]
MSNSQELKQHVSTYHGFLDMMKWGIVVVVLITALVIFLIA